MYGQYLLTFIEYILIFFTSAASASSSLASVFLVYYVIIIDLHLTMMCTLLYHFFSMSFGNDKKFWDSVFFLFFKTNLLYKFILLILNNSFTHYQKTLSSILGTFIIKLKFHAFKRAY